MRRSNSKSLGNHVVSPEEEKERLGKLRHGTDRQTDGSRYRLMPPTVRRGHKKTDRGDVAYR